MNANCIILCVSHWPFFPNRCDTLYMLAWLTRGRCPHRQQHTILTPAHTHARPEPAYHCSHACICRCVTQHRKSYNPARTSRSSNNGGAQFYACLQSVRSGCCIDTGISVVNHVTINVCVSSSVSRDCTFQVLYIPIQSGVDE
jgi:hypothetical protein